MSRTRESERRHAVATGNSNSGLWWFIAVVAVLGTGAIISKPSTNSARTPTEVATTDPTIKSLSSAVSAQAPPAVEPLDAKGVAVGLSDMGKAAAVEGLPGAMIYSQNCYDALSRSFTWRQLDVCGGADLKGVALVPEDEIAGSDKEIAYFQSEMAAARYLGAATGAGITPDQADERLAILQDKIPAARPIASNVPAFDDSSTDHPGADDDNGSATAETVDDI